ncbi:unnamed protein product [Adineta steineri]|uniref:F-box domain-containing protein n=1 Tax=Adineta steineri TaxID=433720 RepID=A0A819VSS6_9BILA|nr:unnamed protein product [Adineta steineri]CAF4113772.1 unnamed protein product [Adineta steineri]
MNFECLPNELLLDILKYLTGIDLFRVFHGLNKRFNDLLSLHFQHYGLDFQPISKQDFEIICKQYLLSMVHEITSLRLSDDDDTPQQTTLFLSYGFTLNQFTHLQSLSLCHLRSDEIIDKILTKLYYLTHLSLSECYCPHDQKNVANIINTIWSLPRLTHCWLDITIENTDYFITPSIISFSLTHVSIKSLFCNLKELASLFHFTPGLQYLHVGIIERSNDFRLPMVVSSIRSLNLSRVDSRHVITTLLQHMPNLRSLTVVTEDVYIDGYQWQQIISDYLPAIEIFRFRMGFRSYNNNEKEQEVIRLLNSFRGPFWFVEHQWFVRCHWNPTEGYDRIYVYTLPYIFEDFPFLFLNKGIQFESTCPDDDAYLSYDHTRHLCYYSYLLFNNALFRIRFSNLHHLSVELPLSDCFRAIFPKLNHLISLDVWSCDDCDNTFVQSQLQMLLDWIPYLTKLSFVSWPNSFYHWPFVRTKNRSIDRLEFEAPGGSGYSQVFNDELCAKLISSSLGTQCQTLVIRVKNRTNIMDLINSMNNLRAMSVRCEEEDDNDDDEIIEWLRSRLPLTCTITRDIRFSKQIRLWISRIL